MANKESKACSMDPRVKLASVAALFLAMGACFICLWQIKMGLKSGYVTETSVAAKIYFKTTVTPYVPLLAHPSRKFATVAWVLAYSPISVVVGSLTSCIVRVLVSFLLVKPAVSLIDDPESRPNLLGVDTPRLCHLDEILYSTPCGEGVDLDIVRELIATGAMIPFAPPTVSVNIADRPLFSEELPDEAKKETTEAGRKIRKNGT